MTRVRQALRRPMLGAVAATLVLGMSIGEVHADPAADAMARLDELSQQAVQTREAVTNAQRDVDEKEAAQAAADERHRADLEALAAANSRLEPYQNAVDGIAAMTYLGGAGGEFAEVLTATSPQQLINKLSLRRIVTATTAENMKMYRVTREHAATAAEASAKSAAAARAAAEQADAVREDLQAKWDDLLTRIAAAEAQYAALTPQQQAVIDNAGAPPNAPAPDAPVIAAMPDRSSRAAVRADIPEALPVGVANEAGLQRNSILAARAVSARFPEISHIGGVRPDSKPWHPRGLAIDIMIPNPESPEGIALGDEILAFAMANAARFGLQDVIWRGTYYTPAGPQASGYGHYDHVHITTLPSR